MERYANDLIWIFMYIYENMRNKRKMVEKISVGVHTTLPKFQLLTLLDYQTCYRITRLPNSMIYKLSNLHIHGY